MPKVNKKNRTPLQEKILVTLALLTCTVGQGAFFRTTAINRILGGRWTEYRQATLDQLVYDGWLIRKKIHAFIPEEYYALSDTGFTSLSNQYDVKKTEVWKSEVDETQATLL